MTKPIYTNNYRRNLTLYWQQYFPEYQIPKGYHVHHIIPQCLGGTHHPKNLIALHPNDHVSIHICRGDKYVKEGFMLNVIGRNLSQEVKDKISKKHQGKRLSADHKQKISNAIQGKKHTPNAIINMKKAQIKSAETKEKLSMAHKGKKKSAEHCNNISKAKKGITWKLINGKRVYSKKDS